MLKNYLGIPWFFIKEVVNPPIPEAKKVIKSIITKDKYLFLTIY